MRVSKALFAVFVILSPELRAEYIVGEEAQILGGEKGFFRPALAGAPAPASPTFDLVAGDTTPNDLSDTLTVNSVSLDLVCSLTAQDVSGTNLTGRTQSGSVTFSEAGTGTSPVVSSLTPFKAHDANERAIFYTLSQKYHSSAGTSDCEIATEDFVVELVAGPQRVTNAFTFSNTSATDGFEIRNNSTSVYRLTLRTSSTASAIDGGAPNSWNHVLWFIDRDEASTNGAIAYTNGSAGTGVNVSARSATLANSTAATLGGSASNSTTTTAIRIWKCPSGTPQCLAGGATNPTQWAPIARERAAIAFGAKPNIAAGTAGPTALTRATNAHVDVVDGSTRHLYLVGNGAPRVARRTYSGGTVFAGYMSEPASTNIALQSQTLGTTWAAITAGDNVLADAFAGADLTTTGDDVDGNNSNAEHGLRQSITLTAATYTMSAWAKAGAQSLVVLRNATIANGAAWFDVATCTSGSCTIGEDCSSAVKTTQAGVIQARAQRWPIDTTGDGTADVNLCRVSISYTGTAAAHNHDILCAPSDGVLTYTDADATADCGFWGVRVEAFPTMTSYLATAAASVARNADDMRFDGASHYTGSPSTMDVQVLCPNYDVAANQTFVAVGPSSTDYAAHRISTADEPWTTGSVTTTQWSITGTGSDAANGVAHAIRTTMATNAIEGFYDGASFGTDNTATLPTVAASTIYLGTTGGTAAQPACLISRVRLWSSLETPSVNP